MKLDHYEIICARDHTYGCDVNDTTGVHDCSGRFTKTCKAFSYQITHLTMAGRSRVEKEK